MQESPETQPGQSSHAFWRGEVDRSRRVAEPLWPQWQENVNYYTGQSPDAQKAVADNADWVNVNVDFYQAQLKQAQLFYETPDLQLSAKGPFRPIVPAGQPAPPLQAGPILQAHRSLLNELLGPDYADVLTTVQKAIQACLVPSGFGPTKVGYEPTMHQVEPPAQLGAVLGLNAPISVPVHERWYWDTIPAKKFRIPADFHDTDYDRAPWLGMDFRMPMSVARKTLNLPEDFEGRTGRDERVLNDHTEGNDTSEIKYVDGTEIWYYASLFDADVIHPQVMRRHVICEGYDGFAEKDSNSPYQTIGPDGRLTADSMIGNPIHVLTLRDVPDSAYVPSDCQVSRPLVRELCKFRTQMVQERDANRQFVLYDIDKLPPEIVRKIENRTIGSLIGVEGGALAGGVNSIIAAAVQSNPPRQTYLANDYITRDIEKTHGIDATGAGVSDENTDESATKTAEISRSRNVRMDAERRRVLTWYLKGVAKFSALVCRFMTPQLAVPYLGQEGAQLWGSWNKQVVDGRLAFAARPDSQIRLDAAAERRFALQVYQMVANDPNVVRVEVLKNLFEKAGMDPGRMVVDQLPEKTPEPSIGFSFKGEDLIGPQGAMVREIMAQAGIKISQESIDESAGQMFRQVALGLRDAAGKAVPAQKRPAEHGGPAEQVRPLSKQQGDERGTRPGPNMESAA